VRVGVGVTDFTQPKGSTVSIDLYDKGYNNYLVDFGFNRIYWFHESVINQYCGDKPEKLDLDDDDFDNFLQDAVMNLHSSWVDMATDQRELSSEDLIELNGLLTTFFSAKK
jgi:hypothetical protein